MTSGAPVARIGASVAALVVVLVAGGVRLVGEGRSELGASDAAWEKGDAYGAAVHARSAARAYVPGALHMDLGYEKLRKIAETSERRGDVDAALFAWRALLSAARSSRPFSAPSSEARGAAEMSVARLSAALTAAGRTPSTPRRAPVEESSPGGEPVVPRIGWAALLLAGAALWCGAGVRLARRAWGKDGRLVPAEARLSALMALAGLLAWLAGLLFA